ncbi:DNA replication and repair protein RecF [Acetobacteraceae bacterium]|nr:DNA replication and repair protein RecF [Acetobacteraceae bacterium]
MEVEIKASIVVLFGSNGSGKTNFLEALSFLSPGRGLRSLSGSGVNTRNDEGWAVVAGLSLSDDTYMLSTGVSGKNAHRMFYLDGEPIHSNYKASLFFSCIWTTPHMERLFSSGGSARRKFLDSLISAEYREYTKELLALERMVASRNKILSDHPNEDVWLDGVEDSIARHSIAIAAIRKGFVVRIRHYLNIFPDMPHLLLRLDCPIDKKLETSSALEVEDFLRLKLQSSRKEDRLSKKTSWGAHKTDFLVFYGAKKQRADLSSSGEQKMILLTLILAQAENLKQKSGRVPTLLLDEPLVHLDFQNRNIFLKNLEYLNVPAFLTGTDDKDFSYLQGKADFFKVISGEISLN